MDQTRTDQSEQDRTEINGNKLAGAEQPRPNQCRPKRTDQTWAKQNRANEFRPAQVYQDDLTRTVLTPTDEHRQKPPDRRDQDPSISTDGPDHTKPIPGKPNPTKQIAGQQTRHITTDQTEALTMSPHMKAIVSK